MVSEEMLRAIVRVVYFNTLVVECSDRDPGQYVRIMDSARKEYDGRLRPLLGQLRSRSLLVEAILEQFEEEQRVCDRIYAGWPRPGS